MWKMVTWITNIQWHGLLLLDIWCFLLQRIFVSSMPLNITVNLVFSHYQWECWLMIDLDMVLDDSHLVFLINYSIYIILVFVFSMTFYEKNKVLLCKYSFRIFISCLFEPALVYFCIWLVSIFLLCFFYFYFIFFSFHLISI